MLSSETSESLLPEQWMVNLTADHEKLTPERANWFFTQCESVYSLFVAGMLRMESLDIYSYVDPEDELLCIEFLSTLPEGSELYICMFETSSSFVVDTEVMLTSPENDPLEDIVIISATLLCNDGFPHLHGITLEISNTDFDNYRLTYDRNGSLCGIRISDPQLLKELNLPEKSFLTITDPTDLSIAIRYLNDKFGDIIFSNPIDTWGTVQSMTQGFYKNVDGQIIPMIIYK